MLRIKSTLPKLLAALVSFISSAGAFGSTPLSIRNVREQLPHRPALTKRLPSFIFATADENDGVSTAEKQDTINDDENQVDGVVRALGAAAPSLGSTDPQDTERSQNPAQVFMITREMKRIMVEDLGYKRKEVDLIRLELVSNVIENRIRCPSEGMPLEWVDRDRESLSKSVEETSTMMERLENESKYPLKFPLLGVSVILFGKGFSDAIITLIKVNIDFPGASLTAQFQGIPVLAIDGICVVVGVALGLWTWKTMK